MTRIKQTCQSCKRKFRLNALSKQNGILACKSCHAKLDPVYVPISKSKPYNLTKLKKQ